MARSAASSPTKPSLRDEIQFLDKQIARHYLVSRLSEIPEFVTIWERARAGVSDLMDALEPILTDYFKTLSPMVRGALMSGMFGGGVWLMHDEKARDETLQVFQVLQTTVGHVQTLRKQLEPGLGYKAKLEELAAPLSVPGLVDVLVMHDATRWGVDRLIYDSGPIEGPLRDWLEQTILKDATGLSPAGLALETPGRIRQRLQARTQPLRRHLNRYHLKRRIDLWVMNVVYGQTYEQITLLLQAEGDQPGNPDNNPHYWIRRQIRDARILLDMKRMGRPRKGGVLRQWKLAAE